jgi:hypothetical protein
MAKQRKFFAREFSFAFPNRGGKPASRLSLSSRACELPLDEGAAFAVLEYGFDLGFDFYFLHWITQQVANHPDVASVREFDHYHEIRTCVLEGGMRGMPDAFPAIDSSPARYAFPSGFHGVALVADPFGGELEGAAFAAALNDELVSLDRFVEFAIDAVARCDRDRHSLR